MSYTKSEMAPLTGVMGSDAEMMRRRGTGPQVRSAKALPAGRCFASLSADSVRCFQFHSMKT